MNTKKYVQGMVCALACIAAFTLTSCGSDSFLSDEEAITHITHQAPQTIKAVAPGADTRVSYEETDEGNISVKWKQGDEIILYSPSTQTQLTYRYNGAEESVDAEFELTGEGGELDGEFYAYYGVKLEPDNYYPVTITASNNHYEGMDFCYVTQSGDNSFEHLIPYNAMSAKGVCVNGVITEPIQFKSLMSLVRLTIEMPTGKTPTSLSLITDNYDILIEKGGSFDNMSQNSSTHYANRTSMTLENITSNIFTVNILLIPDDLRNTTLFAYVKDEDDNSYVSDAIRGTDFEEGKWYRKDITVGDFFKGAGTASEPWQIEDKDDWMKIAALSNSYLYVFENGESFKLMNDINIEGIAAIDRAAINLDGNKKRISGINIDFYTQGVDYAGGLFNMLMGGSIKDLTVEGKMTSLATTGGIAGYMQNVTFAGHVISDVDIEPLADWDYYNTTQYAGGIAGGLIDCTMETEAILENKGNVTFQNAGGIAGYIMEYNNPENRMEGILINRGEINGIVLPDMPSSYVRAGGFFGYVNDTYEGKYQFSPDSQSLGKVTATSAETNKMAFAGWIAGFANNTEYGALQATQWINEGYTGTPELIATNTTGGGAYINGFSVSE